MEQKIYKILVVDDEYKMVRVLSDTLVSKGYDVYTAYDGQMAYDLLCAQDDIDLILMDAMMPVLDGYQTTKLIRTKNTTIPIIMLTAKIQEEDQLYGFQCGVDDYITKPFLATILLARIERFLTKNNPMEECIQIDQEVHINTVTRKVVKNHKEVNVTRREFDLLCFLGCNKNQIFTREQLIRQVWGTNYEGDSRTVDTHIKQLRLKVDLSPSLLKTVYGVGYILEVPYEA